MERSSFCNRFFIRENRTNKKGLVMVECVITINGERTMFSTGFKVNPNQWDATKQRVRGKDEETLIINDSLQAIHNKLYEKALELTQKGLFITADLLRDAYFNKVGCLQSRTLLSEFQAYIDERRPLVGKSLAPATFECDQRTHTLIKEFIKHKYKREDLQLTELNYSFITAFHTFLLSVKNHRMNTTVKHIKNFRRVIDIAFANGYMANNPFIKHRVEREYVPKEFLTEEELRRIINKDFDLSRLERMRDVFIFACFTGLAYSDVKSLQPNHIITDGEGRMWIHKKRVKTGVLSRIPLLPIPKLILEKYKGADKMLPIVDCSSTNIYLKEIATLCNINKTVTFHTARHTFATTVTLTNHVSLEVVSKMMGHTNTRMTERYAKVIDQYISEEMDKLEQKFEKQTW